MSFKNGETMTSVTQRVRYSKSKGSQFEYSCQASLQQKYPTIYLTKQLGFQRQFDICSDNDRIAIECKKERNTTWNQAKKYLDKLISVAPEYDDGIHDFTAKYDCYLIYRCNNMPIMVMFKKDNKYYQMEFSDCFDVPFIKHKSTRVSSQPL